jgi:uncharacterized protein
MQFEWDARKAATNLRKHDVAFEDAERVFLDPHRIERPDTRKDYGEDRWITIGFVEPQLLCVVYTLRGDDNITRLISARKADKYERANYRQTHP